MKCLHKVMLVLAIAMVCHFSMKAGDNERRESEEERKARTAEVLRLIQNDLQVRNAELRALAEQQEQEERKDAGVIAAGDEQLARAIALEQEQEAADQEQPVPKKNKREVTRRELELRDYFSGVTSENRGDLSLLAPLMADYDVDNQWLAPMAKAVPLAKAVPQELGESGGYGLQPGELATSPDSQFIVARSNDSMKIWRKDGTLLKELYVSEHTNPMEPLPIAISPDSKRIVTGSSSGAVQIWSIEGKLLHTLRGHTGVVSAVAISPDGTFIATRSFDETTRIWSIDGELLHTMEEPNSNQQNQLAISADSQRIVTGSHDNAVRIWSRGGSLLHTFGEGIGRVFAVALSLDGVLIVTSSTEGIIRIWDMDGKLLHEFTAEEGGLPINVVAISPDSSYIVTATLLDGTVKLWDRNGTLLHTLAVAGNKSSVHSVAISSDGQIIVIGFRNGTTQIWSRDGVLLHTFPGNSSMFSRVAISPDIKFIVTGSSLAARIWRVVQPEPAISARQQEEDKIARGGEIID